MANALFAAGVTDPGTKAVREELAKRAGPGIATGSPNTIQRHLMEWRKKGRPVDPVEPAHLPPSLAADLMRALNAAADVARDKVQERLDQVQAELNEAVAAGEASDVRIEELTGELAARTSERDSMAGQLGERTTEAAALKATVAALQEKNASMERDLHAAQATAQAAVGRIEEIRQATDRQLEQARGELEKARGGQVDAERRAHEAEKEAVAAKAHLESERVAKTALDVHLAELQAAIRRLEPDAARALGAEATVTELRAQLALHQETTVMLRGLIAKDGGVAAP